MLGAGMENHIRETGEHRIYSTEYNRLFSLDNVTEKTNGAHIEHYDTVDARCGRNKAFVMFSEFADDDCYVSLSKKTKKSNRLSKSCSDLRVKMSTAYSNCKNKYSQKENSYTNVWVEHF